MRIKFIVPLLSVLLVLILSNCDDVQPTIYNYEYMVFGKYYGECLGENCINIYKIENNKLYKDTAEILPTWEHPYQASYYSELPDSLFNTAKTLLGLIPNTILTDTTKVYGEPDAGDWGGYYIETKYNDIVRYFLLDTKKENIPSSVCDFQTETESIITLLNSTTTRCGYFQIYRVLDQGIPQEGPTIPIDSLTLSNEPIFSIKDIISYSWPTHEFTVTSQADSILDTMNPLQLLSPFVACVGNERIYYGCFVSMLSSYLPEKYPYVQNTIVGVNRQISRALIDSIPDKRNDIRIYNSLNKSGKLIE
jgi:hypothetical protein